MKIVHYEKILGPDLLTQLRKTPLRGNDKDIKPGTFVYENAALTIESVNPHTLTPAQRYVLVPTVATILKIVDEFARHGIDAFAFSGGLLFWDETKDPDKDPPTPFLPPVIEESYEEDGQKVLLINDGIHRVWAANKRGRNLNVVVARNIPSEYPYYAYAMTEGWVGVQELLELKKGFEKKKYRRPDNDYKALFRQFNFVFPGVQEQRKKTSSVELGF